jgi:hypothetical protein
MIEKLSEHLSLNEVIKSQTAARHGIPNRPVKAHLENLKVLANEFFEPLRDLVSAERGKDTPIPISSGYRSKALNDQIGGSTKSQHMKGQALDIDMDGWYEDFDNADLFYLVLYEMDFDQLIWEFGTEEKPEWVHVSYVGVAENRNKVTVAKKVNGKTTYVHLED